MTLTYIGRRKGYTLWKDSMNFHRPYVLKKGRYVGGKTIGTYKNITNLLKKHPQFRRK